MTDDLRITEKLSDGPELGRLIKKLTGKPVKDQVHFGLQPCCSTNLAPAVSILLVSFSSAFLTSFANLSFLSPLQLTESFWKPASEPATEAEAKEENKEEASAPEQIAEAEDVDDDANEESTQEAPVEDDDDEEESSPEAPVENDDDEEESSQEAPVTEQGQCGF